jgi:serine/threonine-protein kinase
MSPEQALGRNDALDQRSDLYSATALLYELLTLEHYLGERPSSTAMLVAIVADDVSFSTLVERHQGAQRAVPGEVLRFLAKGLKKAPEDRFQSADEMVDVLEAILHARAAIGRPFASARRWLRGLALVASARLHFALVFVLAILCPRRRSVA